MKAVLLMLVLLISISCNPATAQFLQTSNDESVVETLAPSSRGKQILIKLGDYYLIYAYPYAPFKDSQGQVMVPLKAVVTLLGGQIKTNPQTRSSFVSWPESTARQKIEFQGSSLTFKLGTDLRQLSSKPAWLPKYNDLLVPLTPILEAIGAEGQWNSAKTIFTLRSEKPTLTGLSMFEEALPSGYRDTQALLPVPDTVTLRRVRVGLPRTNGNAAEEFELDLSLQNMSDEEIPIGKQGLFTLVTYKNIDQISYSGRDTFTALDSVQAAEDHCVRVTSGFTCAQSFGAFDPLQYIVARVRLRDKVPPADEPGSAQRRSIFVDEKLKVVFRELVKAYTQTHPKIEITPTFGSSAALAKRIKNGPGAQPDAFMGLGAQPITSIEAYLIGNPKVFIRGQHSSLAIGVIAGGAEEGTPQDFVNFVLSGKGKQIMRENDYLLVK